MRIRLSVEFSGLYNLFALSVTKQQPAADPSGIFIYNSATTACAFFYNY